MITPRQIRMARAVLNWTMSDLSKWTGLHLNTMARVEKDGAVARESTLNLLKAVFQKNGIVFLNEDGVRYDECITYQKS